MVRNYVDENYVLFFRQPVPSGHLMPIIIKTLQIWHENGNLAIILQLLEVVRSDMVIRLRETFTDSRSSLHFALYFTEVPRIS